MSTESKKNIFRHRPTLAYVTVGAEKTPHTHEHPELIFVGQGSGKFTVENHEYPIKTGDLIIVSKGTLHSDYMFAGENSGESSIVHMGIAEVLLSGMRKNDLIPDPFCIVNIEGNDCDLLRSCLNAIMSERLNGELCSKKMEDDLSEVVIITALRHAVVDIGKLLMKNKQFYEAKEYFDNNYMTINNIEEVCELLKINKYYLTHIFKEKLSMPPVRYLQYKRLEKAKSLILTGVPIKEVAERCGYSDTCYFCKVFKKYLGMSPLKYRQSQLGKRRK